MTVILVIGIVWCMVLFFTLALLRMAALADRAAERRDRDPRRDRRRTAVG